MALPAFTRTLLLLFSGPIVWMLHFFAIYGLAGIVCARPALQAGGAGGPVLTWGVLGLGLLAAAAIFAALFLARRREAAAAPFVRQVATGLGALALVAIAWETTAALLVPGCSPVT